jgi:hypothetical protein
MHNKAVFVLLDLQTNLSTTEKSEIPSWQDMETRPDIFNALYVSVKWWKVIYCFRSNGDFNVCVIWDIFLKALLIKVIARMPIKYFIFNVLIFIDVFGLTSDNNFNVIYPVVCCNVKKIRHNCKNEI